MTSSVSGPPLPSEFDNKVNDVDLPSGHISAYPCKLPSCPDYSKTWNLQSNFLVHLQGQKAHMTTVTVPAVQRAIGIE